MSEASPLDLVYLARPCDARWEDMPGNERMRFCSACSKSVYNTADMTKKEAELFLKENSTSACIRIFRRGDGTLIVDDCPVGLRKARNAAKHAMRICASIVGFLLSALCLSPSQVRASETSSAVEEPFQLSHVEDGPLAEVGWGRLDDSFNFNSVRHACKLSKYIIVAEYLGFENTENISLFDPPMAHFRVIQTLKGPQLTEELRIRYMFTERPAETMPVTWKFSEKMLPEKGSQLILCLWSLSKECAETYNGSYGRWRLNAENLQAIRKQISELETEPAPALNTKQSRKSLPANSD